MAQYVIVGGVAGGAGAAARLRRLDENAEITIFERGDYVSYANCGLPYYAGGTIAERSRLFIMTPEKFRESLNVDVRVSTEVVSIDRAARTVRARNLKTGEETEHRYDALVLSPGAAPIKPPIPGIDDQSILTLRSVSDVDAIKARLDRGDAKRAVVVGGGFIGLEMAEALRERSLAVTLVEALDQVMGVVDYDIAAVAQEHLRSKGVDLRLKDGVAAFERRGGTLSVKLSSGAEIPTDLVILSIGVRPDTALARAAGLELAQNGAIKVDEYFATSDPAIRAVGDAIEFRSPLLGSAVTIPLAGPANKQARLCADNIVLGNKRPYRGAIGTSVAKVFDLTVASTGLSAKALERAGLPYATAVTHAGSHAGYYPKALPLTLKIHYHPDTGKVWGAQAIGYDGADKRVDVIAALIGKEATVSDLAEFEHAYAPPYSSAKDPVNMLGFVAENAMDGMTRTVDWKEAERARAAGAFMLDVRSPEEFSLGAITGAVNIPHTELRARLAEVPRDRDVIINCAIGLRGYLAERVLRQAGYDRVSNLTGGYKTWKAATSELALLASGGKAGASRADRPESVVADDGSPGRSGGKSLLADACGLQCPGPIIKLKKEMDSLERGDRLTIRATDPGFARDVESWCSLTGNRLVSLGTAGGIIEAVVERGGEAPSSAAAGGGNGATFIVFSNDMDRALASFVLANGAAATGREVTMFFTFWGLSVIRKRRSPRVRKDFLGRMFGMMLPKGMGKLSLSAMNFAGIGPKLMRFRMKTKNVDQLESMFAQARMAGVRLVACQMSMDIMGIKAEELLDGVEIGGVASYLEAAAGSGVNLFI
ncbi:MAG TPA: FAD-dependent oxidoreductase [Treponemataceae bacterium]|jgi:NADPH-dependent 2,4-dienoyl-CoA reductase/sulfur reductase-like enzyme/peroxiredoxin family protein/rhodanese-related sulfurtransferase/TusA-related sulfurtransferase|nr:FAD-dependent oxidoreductase [Treponemataceae bacterium]